MSKLGTIREIIRIMRRGEHVGDAAALKLTLTADEPPGPHTEAVLARAGQNFEALDFDALAGMPEGSFGRAYADFMTLNGLKPLNFSERSRPIFARYPVSMRYVRVHDLVHVLLGLGTDAAGEAGVYAFVAEQRYTPTLDKAARAAHRFSKLLFWARARVREAERIGREAAQGARILVAEPLEDLLDQPLETVRRSMGIAP